MDAAQVVGPEHTPAAPLKFLENVQGFSQFFVRSRHRVSLLSVSLQVYRAVLTQVYSVVQLQVNYAAPIQVYYAFNRISHYNTVAYKVCFRLTTTLKIEFPGQSPGPSPAW